MRKLASIQPVAALLPIPGADKIEIAQIGGWNVVVKKGEFNVGDLGVYFEIDSFLPAAHPAFEFLAKDAKERDGVMRVRLKTIRLRKQLSQGLLLPIGVFPELTKSVLGLRVLTEGDDVTELLNIEKYEPLEEVRANGGPADTRSRVSQWPFFLQKTDQERAQNAVPQIERAAAQGETFEVTTKLDGSSMTVYVLSPESPYYAEARAIRLKAESKGKSWWQRFKARVISFLQGEDELPPIYGVCSRNREIDINANDSFAQYVRDNKVFENIEAWRLPDVSIAFQGELIAPSIQGNYEKVTKPEWYVYDVYQIDKQQYALPLAARAFTAAAGLAYVPIASTDFKLWQEGGDPSGRAIVDKMLAAADCQGMNPGVRAEGQVYKSNTTSFSFKAISNYYLERKG